ncbi:MAG: dTDP-glucose 4,6-dehydratase [Verrucomicrobiae bacterium]|nr:dTDP-glucose 4,6-dehydratase [Verrucomicrobiae bacterium]
MHPETKRVSILVTGGAGFIGSSLVRTILNREFTRGLGVEVVKLVNLDKLTYSGNLSNLDEVADDQRHIFVKGDICDRRLIGDLLKDYCIDAVVHLAAESHVDRSIDDASAFIETNVVGTHCLLEEFRLYIARRSIPRSEGDLAGRFIHVSTDEVYGSLDEKDPAFNETTPYAPNSPYSASKAASDHFARAYYHTFGLPVIVTNCSNNYGPRQFPEKLMPLMICKVLRGEMLPVYGDGRNVRDWLFVDDHSRALLTALVRGIPGECYAIGGRCEMRNIDIVRAIFATVKELAPDYAAGDVSDRITFVADRPGHDQRYAIDSTKIERHLGWSPFEDFSSGLRKTVQWYLDNSEWIKAIDDGTYRGERLGRKPGIQR